MNVLEKPTDVASQIAAYLKSEWIPQSRLVKALGVSATQVSKMLRGERPITAENLKKINEELGQKFAVATEEHLPGQRIGQ